MQIFFTPKKETIRKRREPRKYQWNAKKKKKKECVKEYERANSKVCSLENTRPIKGGKTFHCQSFVGNNLYMRKKFKRFHLAFFFGILIWGNTFSPSNSFCKISNSTGCKYLICILFELMVQSFSARSKVECTFFLVWPLNSVIGCWEVGWQKMHAKNLSFVLK